MSDPAMPRAVPWLAVRLEHAYAGFTLRARFTLERPWAVLFGPSGSGKTTLLRAIAGLMGPDSGEVRLQGTPCFSRVPGLPAAVHLPPQARRVGLATQAPALFPHLTIAENVGFALRGIPSEERREKVQELLHRFGAEEIQDRLPRQVSGGEQQRAALARTLAAGPRVLLLDEPFSAMDQGSRQQVLEGLQRWTREHAVPALLVTHRLAESFLVGGEVVVLDNGAVMAQGNAAQVLRKERERLLAELDAPPSGPVFSADGR